VCGVADYFAALHRFNDVLADICQNESCEEILGESFVQEFCFSNGQATMLLQRLVCAVVVAVVCRRSRVSLICVPLRALQMETTAAAFLKVTEDMAPRVRRAKVRVRDVAVRTLRWCGSPLRRSECRTSAFGSTRFSITETHLRKRLRSWAHPGRLRQLPR
jgi:hypothetical protein